MTSGLNNAKVTGNFEKNNAGRMLIVKYVYLRD